jgi:uncharacterized protein
MKSLEQNFELPWYQKGLSFSCTQCGKCCSGSPGFVAVSEEEMEEMAAFLKIDIKTFKRLYIKRRDQQWLLVERKRDHSCIFYKEKLCQVYGARPLQCRTYPFWPENLRNEKSWEVAALECEGINENGEKISADAIESLLKIQQ